MAAAAPMLMTVARMAAATRRRMKLLLHGGIKSFQILPLGAKDVNGHHFSRELPSRWTTELSPRQLDDARQSRAVKLLRISIRGQAAFGGVSVLRRGRVGKSRGRHDDPMEGGPQ
jgi:hypothetical protein